MRFQEDFAQFLALALAIHRRDEVACSQFIQAIANQVTNEFEEAEMFSGRTANRKRQDEKLDAHMAEHMKQLDGLIDDAGRNWLRSMLGD